VRRATKPRRPAVQRLRRLRWLLTAIFTVMNTIGLVIFAPLILDLDASRRQDAEDADLKVVTSSVLRLVRDEGSPIGLGAVSADPLNDTCPQFVVRDGGSTAFDPYSSRHNCVGLDERKQDQIAGEAVTKGVSIVADARGTGGEPVRIRAEPFRESGSDRFAGAVVAWADLTEAGDRHRRVLLVVLAGCAVLLSGAAAVGYVLSGRAIRPAGIALEQQEVLLAETAHDLRTPVAALRALAETAAQDPAQRAELLPRTVRLAGRMGDIIDGLLVRARLAAGVEQLSMQPVWLDQLVDALVEDTPAEGARVSVVTVPTKVRADPALVQRAIGNLLDNALRHGGGTARVAVARHGPGAVVTVEDEGSGIAAGHEQLVFTLRVSTAGGAGIGLALARDLVESAGGRLALVRARPPRFELVLPRG
jgi:two-component system, OmpR family, sensor kinase